LVDLASLKDFYSVKNALGIMIFIQNYQSWYLKYEELLQKQEKKGNSEEHMGTRY